MRKLIMAVAVLGMSATMNFAKAQCVNEYGNKEPFAVEFSRLSSYLGLLLTKWRRYLTLMIILYKNKERV